MAGTPARPTTNAAANGASKATMASAAAPFKSAMLSLSFVANCCTQQ